MIFEYAKVLKLEQGIFAGMRFVPFHLRKIRYTQFSALILCSCLSVFASSSDIAADQSPAARTPFDPMAFESYGEKVLYFESDIADAVMMAREEAVRQNVSLDELTRYFVSSGKGDFLRVTIAPPYTGGLDGPEFRVVFRRSDLKLLEVENRLR